MSETAPSDGRSPRGAFRTRLMKGWPVAALALGAVSAPGTAMEATLFALHNLARLAPVILFALLITALATATGAVGLVGRAFKGRQPRMIVVASSIGTLTPICGVTVFPLVAGLMAARAPLAPIMAFWLSSPITSPGMLAVTAAALGTPFAIGKTVAAFGCGIVGGAAVLALVRAGYLSTPARETRLSAIAGSACAATNGVCWRFWEEKRRRAAFARSLVETGRLMLVWLSLAFLAEFLLREYVPSEWVARLVGTGSEHAVILAATAGAPIYLDGYAALPLIRGLIDSGMRADAAMAFLIAGGITSLWVAVPVFALVRPAVFLLYLGLAVTCSMLAGWGYGLYAN